MSRETSEWLNQNVLVGYTETRGNAWHYKASDQGEEANHYDGAIPLEDVKRRLFDWEAESCPVFIRVKSSIDDATGMDDEGNPYKMIQVEDRQAVIHGKTNAVFNIFKDGYKTHQFDSLLTMASNIIDDSINIGSAGLLRKGAVGWVSIEMPESIEVLDGFDVRSHLILTTSHDGTLATTIKPVDTFVVCDNTHVQAMSENGAQFKARHSKYSTMRISNVQEALGFVHRMSESAAEEINRLVEWKVTDDQFKKVIANLCAIPNLDDSSQTAVTKAENRRSAIVNLYKEDSRVAPWAGTALGVLQAFNTYNHHFGSDVAKRTERNMLNVLNGKTEKADTNVLRVLASV